MSTCVHHDGLERVSAVIQKIGLHHPCHPHMHAHTPGLETISPRILCFFLSKKQFIYLPAFLPACLPSCLPVCFGYQRWTRRERNWRKKGRAKGAAAGAGAGVQGNERQPTTQGKSPLPLRPGPSKANHKSSEL